jgi:hypothetical protein
MRVLGAKADRLPERKNPEKRSVYQGFEDGAESQNRTGDTRFFRPVLYRLSYLGNV